MIELHQGTADCIDMPIATRSCYTCSKKGAYDRSFNVYVALVSGASAASLKKGCSRQQYEDLNSLSSHVRSRVWRYRTTQKSHM